MIDYCDCNCFFVFGEGLVGIWLVVMVFVVLKEWCKVVFCFVLLLCVILFVNWVVFGGYFLFDIMLVWGLIFFVILSVYWLFYKR